MKSFLLLITFICLTFAHHGFAQSINFTFHNGSLKSIPLVIPSVMNPNLNPLSNSGVSLNVGQKVYFYPYGTSKKRELLFTVDESFQQDQILEIDAMIEKRKKELKAH
ncbi:MAG: hypothetical protein ORN53_02585 [Crocinitomicaceae bacterium]|jgi:hypothetical protein|nr:hypothetical protein [Crocinitomicaceae bacterium]